MLNGIVRHIPTATGCALVKRDTIAESKFDLTVGAIIALVGIIWSAFAKRKAPAILASPAWKAEAWAWAAHASRYNQLSQFGGKVIQEIIG